MTFDEQLQRTLDSFADRLREEVARQVRAVGSELAAIAPPEIPPHEGATDADRLLAGIRALDDATSLSGILDALVSHAPSETSRAGLVLVRGDGFRSWSLPGFETPGGDSNPLDVSSADAGVIAEAKRTAAIASIVDESNTGEDRPQPPQGGTNSPGLRPPRFAKLHDEAECVAVPLILYGEVIAVLYADGLDLNHDSLEILSRHAARALEAMTAVKAARSMTPPAASPAGAEGGEATEEHASARRYARILVSEIKLYHEAEVVAGRRERDLTTRLGGEIARARALYEQRVPVDVRQGTDYVHEELIRTLADGDASLLEAKL